MMPPKVRVSFKPDPRGFAALTASGGSVDRGVRRAAGLTRDRAKQNVTSSGRVDTGRLRNSIRSEKRSSSALGVTYEVGSELDYAIYQEEGTRAHGPRRAKVLRFQPKGSSTFVFARRVAGVKAANFLKDALKRLRPSDFDVT